MAEPTSYRTEFGKRLRSARKNRDLTQEQLAEKLDISQKHYSEIERGLAGVSVNILIQISKTLNVSIDYLLLGNETITDSQPELSLILDLYEKSSPYIKRQMLMILQIISNIEQHNS